MTKDTFSTDSLERDWAALTVKELRLEARDAGIEGRSRMTKAQLVDALQQSAAAAVAVAVEEHVVLSDAAVPADDLPSSTETEEPSEAEPEAAAEPPGELAAASTDAKAIPEPSRPPRAADIYIDYGPELPRAGMRRRVRVMVRDPGHMHVYWTGFEGLEAEQWRLEVIGELGRALQTVRTTGGARSAYLQVPVHEVRRIQLHARTDAEWKAVDAVGRPSGAAPWQPLAEVRFDEATDLAVPPHPGSSYASTAGAVSSHAHR